MNTIESITGFLQNIGLTVRYGTIEQPTFLPGIFIENGGLVIDKSRVQFEGDILHEAGHLAVMPPRIREQLNGDLGNDDLQQGGEIAAIAWSYAACLHLGIDPFVVFHDSGYKGAGKSIVENYEKGSEMGVHLLVWLQMTEYAHSANAEYRFPNMKNWLCIVDK